MEHSFFATTSNRYESLRLLSLAETHLTSRDLLTSKSLATRARELDPSLPLANQILAVIDTLLSSDRRIANNKPDFYGILGMSPQHDNLLISTHYQKLVSLLENNKYPFADVALRCVLEAYGVLSDPMKRVNYDKELAFYLQQQRLSDPFKFCCLPTMQQNFIYFGGAAAAAVDARFSRVENETFNVRMNNNGSENCVRGFLAFVSSNNSVPVVEENETKNGDYANGGERNDCNVNVVEENQQVEQSFMGILGMNNSNDNHVHVSSNNSVPVVEENETKNGDYGNGGERNGCNVNVVEENQQVEQSFMGILGMNNSNDNHVQGFSAFVNNSSVPVIEENETDGDYATGGEINGPGVNVVEENEMDGDCVNASEVVEEEKEDERVEETGNDGVEDTFWTACPYCCCMFEYPGVYVNCCMRCQFCKSAFQTVVIASPPDIVEGDDGKEGYHCCWSFPVGVSKESREKCNEGVSGWTPFSTMFAEPGMGTKEPGGKSSGPRVYIDDDEAWMESSESEEFDDVDWNKEKNNRKIGQTRVTRSSYKIAKKVQGNKCSGKRKKGPITPARKQPSRAAKNSWKLDLNVECCSNESDEPPSKGNLSRGRGEEDNVEGNGFFEGLDEYLSSFPILDGVEGDD